MAVSFSAQARAVFSSLVSQFGELLAVFRFHGGGIPQPVVARPRQTVIPGGSQSFVFLPPYPIHCFTQMRWY